MPNQAAKLVIVLGDWFIDENWLVSQRNTRISSHTGDVHFLTKHTDASKRMTSLCGAAEVMEVLRNHFKTNESLKFLGFGAWNVQDDHILQCALCSEEEAQHRHLTRFSISGPRRLVDEWDCPYKRTRGDSNTLCVFYRKASDEECPRPIHRLVNIGTASASTNRIVRVYEGAPTAKPHLLYRFDWQLDVPTVKTSKIAEAIPADADVAAVIIEDHDKGVVTEDTVTALRDALPETSNPTWFMRSKIGSPKWLSQLAGDTFRRSLIVMDSKVARNRTGRSTWKVRDTFGRAALALFKELTTGSQSFDRAAIILDDCSCIAVDSREVANAGDADCYIVAEPQPESEQLISVGRTTMFFLALIAQELTECGIAFEMQCAKALRCANQWSKQASEAWRREDHKFYGEYSTALSPLSGAATEPTRLRQHKHRELEAAWERSSQDLGTIENQEGIEEFQTWRGESILETYIAVGELKRAQINDLTPALHKNQLDEG